MPNLQKKSRSRRSRALKPRAPPQGDESLQEDKTVNTSERYRELQGEERGTECVYRKRSKVLSEHFQSKDGF